uniref:Thioredoxin h n=1 Tax=Codonopsis lanceolata TaxID=103999 RepID=Q4ACU9_9ASTR|nr:thioredoxin h [Codonopsis lanceolata]
MEHHQISISKVVKVDSKQTWDSLVIQAINQSSPIVAHFTASWCIPSVVMNPFFEELASTYKDTMFLLVDVDDVQEVASKYEVKAMPTFVLMKEGAQVDKLIGANPDEIRKRIESLIQSNPICVA